MISILKDFGLRLAYCYIIVTILSILLGTLWLAELTLLAAGSGILLYLSCVLIELLNKLKE